MVRTAATVALILVAAWLLTACGAATSERATRSGGRDDAGLADETFTPDAVASCLERAKTSLGNVMVDGDPYAGGLTAPDGLLSFWLLQTDYGLPGVTIAFVGDAASRARFEKKASAFESDRVGADFARALVFRQSGNVVFYYEKQTSPEVVRIAHGCLGGPPYAGDGGEPPSGGYPIPTFE